MTDTSVISAPHSDCHACLTVPSSCPRASNQWWVLWLLAKDENGLVSKDKVRGCMDGSLWVSCDRYLSSPGTATSTTRLYPHYAALFLLGLRAWLLAAPAAVTPVGRTPSVDQLPPRREISSFGVLWMMSGVAGLTRFLMSRRQTDLTPVKIPGGGSCSRRRQCARLS